MFVNVQAVESLRSLARVKARPFDSKSIHPRLVEEETAKGWTISKTNKTSVRLVKPKSHGAALEDRVWSLLYKMQRAGPGNLNS